MQRHCTKPCLWHQTKVLSTRRMLGEQTPQRFLTSPPKGVTRLFRHNRSPDLTTHSFPRTRFLGSAHNKSLTASVDGVLIPKSHTSHCQSRQSQTPSTALILYPGSGRNDFTRAPARALDSFALDGGLHSAEAGTLWAVHPSRTVSGMLTDLYQT